MLSRRSSDVFLDGTVRVAMNSERVSIETADGFTLAGTHFYPGPGAPSKARIIISAATGVPRGFYVKFASFLAQQGMTALTYDYRGIGESRPRRLRGFQARMADWGVLDLAAVIDWMDRRREAGPLSVVGHSVGGQIIGLAHNSDRVDGVLTVAAQSGDLSLWKGLDKAVLATLYYVLLPGLPSVLGYFPSRYLGLGEDLPAGVAREWSRWARTPGYLLNCLENDLVSGYRRFAGTMRAMGFWDDRMAPAPAVERLLDFYPSARREFRLVTSKEARQENVGHFGFFRERSQDPLWREAGDWLLSVNRSTV